MNKKVTILILILLVLICCSPATIDQEREIPVDIVFSQPDSNPVSLDELFGQIEKSVLDHYPNAELVSISVKGKCEDSFPETGEYSFNFLEVTDTKKGIFGSGGASRFTTAVLIPADEHVKITTKEMAYTSKRTSLNLPLPPSRQVEQIFELVSFERKYYLGDCNYSLRVSNEGRNNHINFQWLLFFHGTATESRPEYITVDYYLRTVDNE